MHYNYKVLNLKFWYLVYNKLILIKGKNNYKKVKKIKVDIIINKSKILILINFELNVCIIFYDL